MIVEALAGIGEVVAGDDVGQLIIEALEANAAGLLDGDVLVITSKIISKAEGRQRPAADRVGALAEQTVRTVARRGPTSIVVNRLGITQAAAGIDTSNVGAGQILLLPSDPDASAAGIRARLESHFGVRLAVIISDTSGRAWRVGQTDHAIGLCGLAPVIDYGGTTDGYGNALAATSTAVADELAAAADLVKGKLRGRPVALIRGAGLAISDQDHTARDLLRPPHHDLFARGQREAVLWAALGDSAGRESRYEHLVTVEDEEMIAEVTADLEPAEAVVLARLLRVFAPPTRSQQ